MSGLYNMLMERNPYGPYLMGCLGFVQGAEQNKWLGRFRDVYTNEYGNRIFLLHRNCPESNEFNQAIKQHPNFVKNEVDSRDGTYGVWEFTVPEQYTDLVSKISVESDNTPAMDRYWQLIEDMKNGVKNEAVENALEVGKKIFEPILNQLNGKETESEHVVKHGDGTVVVQNFTKETEADSD